VGAAAEHRGRKSLTVQFGSPQSVRARGNETMHARFGLLVPPP